MTFDPGAFGRMIGPLGSGYSEWHYITTDPAAEIIANGYFNDAVALGLRSGDAINVSVEDVTNRVGRIEAYVKKITNGGQVRLRILHEVVVE